MFLLFLFSFGLEILIGVLSIKNVFKELSFYYEVEGNFLSYGIVLSQKKKILVQFIVYKDYCVVNVFIKFGGRKISYNKLYFIQLQ